MLLPYAKEGSLGLKFIADIYLLCEALLFGQVIDPIRKGSPSKDNLGSTKEDF